MNILRVAELVLVLGVSVLMGCEEEPGPEYSFYRIHVDSIQAPSRVEAAQPFKIKFYGVVGTDGCHQFSRFDTVKNPVKITVELWGRSATGKAIMCPDVMVFLEGRELELTIEQPGNYQLEIRQPDGNHMIKNIQIE